MNRSQQLHDVAPVCRVQVARRFVGEHDRRIVGERAGERDALLLAARQLRGIVMRAAGQSDFLEQRRGALPRVGDAGDFHRHGHVLVRGQRRNEVEELEHEADLLAAQAREAVFVELRDVDLIDQHLAGRRLVEARDEPEQRRFAAARRPDDGDELTSENLKRERVEDRERLGAAHDGLGHLAQLDHDPRCATGFNTLQTLSATIRAPSAVG